MKQTERELLSVVIERYRSILRETGLTPRLFPAGQRVMTHIEAVRHAYALLSAMDVHAEQGAVRRVLQMLGHVEGVLFAHGLLSQDEFVVVAQFLEPELPVVDESS